VGTVRYHVRDLDAARAFYRDQLGFEEMQFDTQAGWAKLVNGPMEIELACGEPDEEGGVAHVDVDDVKAVAERLRVEGVQVGVVLELPGIRLLDVYDPDGNRIQLSQQL
jgi:catechol 2,3-dioxygenase-like lactoylglutathione lyase family enzyme